MITELNDKTNKMTVTLTYKWLAQKLGKCEMYVHDSFLSHTFLSWHCKYGGMGYNYQCLSQFKNYCKKTIC